jgi:hypothetical protein
MSRMAGRAEGYETTEDWWVNGEVRREVGKVLDVT